MQNISIVPSLLLSPRLQGAQGRYAPANKGGKLLASLDGLGEIDDYTCVAKAEGQCTPLDEAFGVEVPHPGAGHDGKDSVDCKQHHFDALLDVVVHNVIF